MRRRVLIDIETTALTPQRGEIIRLYARDLDDPCSTFNKLVKPKRPLSNLVEQITEITNEMLREAPSLEAVLPEFLDFLDGAFIYSYSPSFEQSFLSSFREVAERIKICKR
jgi:DNA polymerase III alpha subunit (gram-positive type)